MAFLGTYLGTRLGTSLGKDFSPGTTELSLLETFVARNAYTWMRADYRTEASGKVTQFNDKVQLVSEGAVAPNARSIDPAHAWTQGSVPLQVPAITTSASWGEREAAVFSAHTYDSTVPVANWSFTADGTGFHSFTMVRPTSNAGSRVPWGTTSAGSAQGMSAYFGNTTHARWAVYKAGGTVIADHLTSGTVALNVPVCFEQQHATARSPNFYGRVGATSTTGAYGSAAAVGDTNSVMRIGSNAAGALAWIGDIAEIVIFNRLLTAPENTSFLRYLQLRYSQAL